MMWTMVLSAKLQRLRDQLLDELHGLRRAGSDEDVLAAGNACDRVLCAQALRRKSLLPVHGPLRIRSLRRTRLMSIIGSWRLRAVT